MARRETSFASWTRLPPMDPEVSMITTRVVLGSRFSSFWTNSTGSSSSRGSSW